MIDLFKHSFHKKCIETWKKFLREDNKPLSCPECRIDVNNVNLVAAEKDHSESPTTTEYNSFSDEDEAEWQNVAHAWTEAYERSMGRSSSERRGELKNFSEASGSGSATGRAVVRSNRQRRDGENITMGSTVGEEQRHNVHRGRQSQIRQGVYVSSRMSRRPRTSRPQRANLLTIASNRNINSLAEANSDEEQHERTRE